MEIDAESEGSSSSSETAVAIRAQLEPLEAEEAGAARTGSRCSRVFDCRVVNPDRFVENVLSFVLTEELLQQLNKNLATVLL